MQGSVQDGDYADGLADCYVIVVESGEFSRVSATLDTNLHNNLVLRHNFVVLVGYEFS